MAPAWRGLWGGGGGSTGSAPYERLPLGSEAAWLDVDGGRMAARGPLPPGPGHRKPRVATWWAGAGNPQRRERWSLRAPKGVWNFEEWEKPEAQILITSVSSLWAYVSAPPLHGPLELSPQSSCEVRSPARCKWHLSVLGRQRKWETEGDWTGAQLFLVVPTAP